MTGSGLFLVQQGIYTALTGDVTFMALISGVYDEPPSSPVFPYVTLGDSTENPYRTYGKGGHDETVTIHVWSQAPGFKEAMNIVSQMTTVLDAGTVTVGSHTVVLVNFENANTMRDADGITRHIAARYRVTVQEL